MTSKATDGYEKTLRTIGQGLETLGVADFVLVAQNNQFVVDGHCERPKTDPALKPNKFKKLLLVLLDKSKPLLAERSSLQRSPASFEFTGLRFTRKDIDSLEREGETLRSNREINPNPHRVSQLLRIVGSYLDHNGACLSRLSWDHGSVTLWCVNKTGGESKEIFTPVNLYDYWVHQYKKRGAVYSLKRTGND